MVFTKENTKSIIKITFILIAVLMSFLTSVFAVKRAQSYTYNVEATQNWQKDPESSSVESGYDHYYFSEDPSIDLILTKYEGEIQSNDFQKLYSEILNGKNWVQKFIGEGPVIISDFKVELNTPNLKRLSYKTRYKFMETDYETLEVISLRTSVNLQAILRWSQKSEPESVKKSQQSFQKLEIVPIGDKNGK